MAQGDPGGWVRKYSLPPSQHCLVKQLTLQKGDRENGVHQPEFCPSPNPNKAPPIPRGSTQQSGGLRMYSSCMVGLVSLSLGICALEVPGTPFPDLSVGVGNIPARAIPSTGHRRQIPPPRAVWRIGSGLWTRALHSSLHTEGFRFRDGRPSTSIL